MSAMRDPGALAGATGAEQSFVATLNVSSIHSTCPCGFHHVLRAQRLRSELGLSELRAALIASLAFDGDR